MLQLHRFFRDEKGLEQTDIYYQAHVNCQLLIASELIANRQLNRLPTTSAGKRRYNDSKTEYSLSHER